jgi:hypothetical protein
MGRIDSQTLLRGVVADTRRALPPEFRAAQATKGFGLIKLYYGNPKLHYEANHQARSRTIEIGLHFEADRFTNARLLGAFRVHEKRIQPEIPGARLEQWDKGWARVWEPIAYEELDVALQREVAGRLARYISVLEPMLREELPADVPWALASSRSPSRASRSGSPTKARPAARRRTKRA